MKRQIRFSYLLSIILLFITTVSAAQIKCDFCGKQVQGRYFSLGDKNYCEECVNNNPRCFICGHLQKSMGKYDGKEVCNKYLKNLAKCYICGAPMIKKMIYQNGEGVKCEICMDCHKHHHNCFNCGLPVYRNEKPIEKNRYICRFCDKYEIDSQAYKKILAEVKNQVQKQLKIRTARDYPIYVVSLTRLQQIKDPRLGDALGFFNSDISYSRDGHGNISNMKREGSIYVVDRLTYRPAYELVAHEYAHSWHFEQKPPGFESDPVDSEGFAEWVAYQVLMGKGYKEQAENLKKKRHPYGTGLKKMLQIEKQKGIRGVIEYIKTH